MFGDGIKDAITSNILKSGGYPQFLTVLMCICVAIIPLTKIPLNARPLITTADVLAGIHHNQHTHPHNPNNTTASRRTEILTSLIRFSIRLTVVAVLLCISILFPAFDSVCAFLGAALCTLISVVLPISFYLKLFWKDVTARETMVLLALLGLFAVFGVVGTIWTFLPKELIGIA
jgi:vesicular inhibitory amino acid transporter